MRHAQKTALMAMFAAMAEHEEKEREAAMMAPANEPGPRTAKPIQVDLLTLAQGRAKTRA